MPACQQIQVSNLDGLERRLSIAILFSDMSKKKPEL